MKNVLSKASVWWMTLSLLCLQCTVTKLWEFQYPLLVPLVYYTYSICSNWKLLKLSKVRNSRFYRILEYRIGPNGPMETTEEAVKRKKLMLCADIIEDTLLAISCFLLLIYCTGFAYCPFYACLTSMSLAVITKLVTFRACKPPCTKVSYTLKLCGNIFRLAQFTFILLKFENMLNWEWSGVLFIYWVTTAILGVFGLLTGLLFFSSVVIYCQGGESAKFTLGSAWAFLVVGGLLASSAYSASNFIKIFESESIPNNTFRVAVFIFGPFWGYLTLAILLTCALWNVIVFWVNIIMFNGHEFNVVDETPEMDIPERPITKMHIQKSLFLKKVSDTLFTQSRQKDQFKIAEIIKKAEGRDLKKHKMNRSPRMKLGQEFSGDFELTDAVQNELTVKVMSVRTPKDTGKLTVNISQTPPKSRQNSLEIGRGEYSIHVDV